MGQYIYESIPPAVRKKYTNADSILISYDELKENIATYDDRIPYFSKIISTIYLTEYIAFLQSNLPQEKIIEKVSEEKSDFEAQFNPAQIELLSECLNKVRMFSETISSGTLKEVFSCTLSQPLKTRCLFHPKSIPVFQSKSIPF